jgi:hypothetical protein
VRRAHAPASARAAVVAGFALLALAGCTPDADGTPGPTVSPDQASPSRPTAPAEQAPPSGTPSVEPGTPDDVPTVATFVSADDVTIEVRAPEGAVAADPDPGWTSVAIDLTRFSPGQAATVGLTTVGELRLHPDGSVTARDVDEDEQDLPSDAVGGLTSPIGAEFTADEAGGLVVVPDDGAGGAVTFLLGSRGVDSADWGEREGGRSLAVTPTAWARQAQTAGVDLVWSELVTADAEVGTATMHDQLVCHSIGAPDKATWNLEPWRPDVGLLQVLAERCNPA